VAPATAETRDPRALAEAAATLEELAAAMRAWPGSPLRESARNLVFGDGLPGARLMVIGEAPGGDEDRVGRPFVGRAGQLLDRMLAAIGLSRTAPAPEDAVYITNILPWRPPGNRTPSEAEARAFLPFVERHIALAAPDVILAVGNTPTKALLATSTGIKRMRGRWLRHGPSGLPVMPCFHPAYLLRTPEDKRLAWLDLLAVRRALDRETPP
jgi:DNA polymerase